MTRFTVFEDDEVDVILDGPTKEVNFTLSGLGPQGPVGPASTVPGPPGPASTVPGPAGPSAYAVAVENGFSGTEEEWLVSLKGEPGADSTVPGPPGPASTVPGPSAYDVAVENGFSGTEVEWLATLIGLQGNPGAPGLSAYQVAVSNGFTGTEEDWLTSLEGADGEPGADSTVPGPDGLSAYQIAVNDGFAGTEEEWLASLEGDPGIPGPAGIKTLAFKFSGTLAVGVGSTRLYNDTGSEWTILSVRTTLEEAPSGGDVVADLNVDDTTVFTTQANRPTVADGSLTSGKVTTMDVVAVPDGSYLSCDVDETTAPAAGLTLTVVVS